MTDSADWPRRRSIRLRGYDYAQGGAYFVTICTDGKACLFGDIVEDEMQLSSHGVIVGRCWEAIPDHFPNVELDAFVIMPNHVHGIVAITEVVEGDRATHASPLPGGNAPARGPKRRSLGAIVGSYKAVVTKQVNEQFGAPRRSLWQRGYFEHIIRSERALERIRTYIEANPSRWPFDDENPQHR